MKMAEFGVGIGLGIKLFKVVFAFESKTVFDQFLIEGWDFGGDADLSAEHDGEGEGVGASASVIPGVKVCELTDTGIALSATMSASKYWVDDELN